MLKNLFIGLPFFKKKKGHFPSSEEREEWDKRLFVYRYNQGNEPSRRDNRGVTIFTQKHSFYSKFEAPKHSFKS